MENSYLVTPVYYLRTVITVGVYSIITVEPTTCRIRFLIVGEVNNFYSFQFDLYFTITSSPVKEVLKVINI